MVPVRDCVSLLPPASVSRSNRSLAARHCHRFGDPQQCDATHLRAVPDVLVNAVQAHFFQSVLATTRPLLPLVLIRDRDNNALDDFFVTCMLLPGFEVLATNHSKCVTVPSQHGSFKRVLASHRSCHESQDTVHALLYLNGKPCCSSTEVPQCSWLRNRLPCL